ncbi:MAG: hypothetical protein PHO94_10075 [Petrimonas sp.]|nr:hypothetical protein [Petrimonas sp.]
MKKYIKYFLILHTAMLFIAGFGVWFILKRFFPEILIDYYFVVPVFFYVMGLIFIFFLSRIPVDKPKRIVNIYMLIRVAKVFAGAVAIMIYWFFDKENIRSFVIIFIVFYLLYLLLETYIYMRLEMYMKYKGDQQKPPRKRLPHK